MADGSDERSSRDDEDRRARRTEGGDAGKDKKPKSDDRDDGDRDADKDGDDDQDGDGDQDGDQDKDGEDEGERKPPPYKRPIFWVVVGVIAAVLLIGGLLYWLHSRQYESTDDAFVDAHIVRLSAQVQGKLTHVAAADNRHVPAGALLATIEPQGPQASLAQARAQAAQAEAQIQQAEAQIVAARAQRDQAAAQARAPEAQAVKAAQDLQRYLALQRLDPQAVAGTQIDQAREQARSAAAQAAAARRQIDNADAQILVARRQAKAARAERAAAGAQVAQAQVTFGYLAIRAPVAGQVVNRNVNVGSYVSAGTQLLAIVPDELYVTANFKETQLAHMRRGQPVRIRVDAYPDVDFEGHVDSIQRGAGQAFGLLPPQNATGNYVKVVQRVPVRILFDHPDPHRYAIGPGMSVVPTVKVR
ncbi:HlyD family secretion protein [Sphingomonas morindae]|uniref:HlyD family secretion protein n=1 Tax=Sphingomonas morindae TaxID=1541170 RepID=A0ABY4XCG6_9SPHN|nr:HlyD family secretion protein [Sphingomonas morindae]USI74375.1 HlyD family secretion protein [Sphingomonas morindae]